MNDLETLLAEEAKLESYIALLTRDISTLEEVPPNEDYDRAMLIGLKRGYLAYAQEQLAKVIELIALEVYLETHFVHERKEARAGEQFLPCYYNVEGELCYYSIGSSEESYHEPKQAKAALLLRYRKYQQGIRQEGEA